MLIFMFFSHHRSLISMNPKAKESGWTSWYLPVMIKDWHCLILRDHKEVSISVSSGIACFYLHLFIHHLVLLLFQKNFLRVGLRSSDCWLIQEEKFSDRLSQWGKNMVWPYHRRHLDFTEWTFTCLSLPFTAVSVFTHLQSQRRWLPSDSGKDEQAWCVSVIKASGQQTWWDTSFHVKFFFWPRPVTHNHSHTDTTCNKCQTWVQCVCVWLCVRMCGRTADRHGSSLLN